MYRQLRTRNRFFTTNNIRNSSLINQTRSMPTLTTQTLGRAISIPKPLGIGKSLISSAAGASSKLGLSGIIGGISKTINTVNQAMPLINQVKPLFGNFKSVFNVVKSFRSKNINKINNDEETTKVIHNEIKDNDVETTNLSEKLQENYQFTPNKPYFS